MSSRAQMREESRKRLQERIEHARREMPVAGPRGLSLLDISIHEPGQWLLLARRGFSAKMLTRLFATFFLGIFAGFPLLLLAAAYAGEADVAPDTPGEAVFMVIFFVLWYAIIGGAVWVAGKGCMTTDRLDLDGQRGIVTLRRGGRWLWLSEVRHLSTGEITRVRVAVRGGDGGGEPVRLVWRFECRNGGTEEVAFRVRTLKGHEEALRLCCDAARVLGFAGYRMRRGDHLVRELWFEPTAIGEDMEGLPAVGVPAALHAGGEGGDSGSAHADGATSGGELSIELPSFEAEGFQFALHGMQPAGIDWRPGEEVEVHSGPLHPALRFTGVIFLGGIAGVFGFFLSVVVGLEHRFDIGVAGWHVGLLVGGFIANLTWYRTGRLFCRREARFDWGSRTLRLRCHKQTFDLPFDQIQGLAVQGYRERHHEKGDSYFCDVFLLFDGHEERLLTSNDDYARTHVYEQCTALASELAEHLGVSWHWRGFKNYGNLQRFLSLDR